MVKNIQYLGNLGELKISIKYIHGGHSYDWEHLLVLELLFQFDSNSSQKETNFASGNGTRLIVMAYPL